MKVDKKENYICEPKIINKILTFESRVFLINDNRCEIVATQINPYLLTIRVNNKVYTQTQEQLIKKLGL
jgi:hypothetical protein